MRPIGFTMNARQTLRRRPEPINGNAVELGRRPDGQSGDAHLVPPAHESACNVFYHPLHTADDRCIELTQQEDAHQRRPLASV
jgi:hypothetical protein